MRSPVNRASSSSSFRIEECSEDWRGASSGSSRDMFPEAVNRYRDSVSSYADNNIKYKTSKNVSQEEARS